MGKEGLGLIEMGAPGCDDAPIVHIKASDRGTPRNVTVVYPYYDNPRFLERQIAGWHEWPVVERAKVNLIIVDDGSPNVPAANVLQGSGTLPLKTRLFRIKVDVRWNWLAARNIGAHHADEGWLLITDMDHVIPEPTLNTVLMGAFDPGMIYRFSRIGTKTHPHPNSWFYTKKMYWKVGGYDEALSGHYGTDAEYRRRCAATAPIQIMSAPLELHEHEDDASTTGYKRKQPEDARGKQMIRARGPKWKPRTLSFPYEEVRL